MLSDDEQKIIKFSLNNEQMSNKRGGWAPISYSICGWIDEHKLLLWPSHPTKLFLMAQPPCFLCCVLPEFFVPGIFGTMMWVHIDSRWNHVCDNSWYCWWKKSCTSWYGKYPIVYRVLYNLGGEPDFFHQQYAVPQRRREDVEPWMLVKISLLLNPGPQHSKGEIGPGD